LDRGCAVLAAEIVRAHIARPRVAVDQLKINRRSGGGSGPVPVSGELDMRHPGGAADVRRYHDPVTGLVQRPPVGDVGY